MAKLLDDPAAPAPKIEESGIGAYLSAYLGRVYLCRRTPAGMRRAVSLTPILLPIER